MKTLTLHGRRAGKSAAARELSADERAALAHTRAAGGGVFSPALARQLRDIDHDLPGLVEITDGAAAADEAGCTPFFTAALTAAGMAAINAKLTHGGESERNER